MRKPFLHPHKIYGPNKSATYEKLGSVMREFVCRNETELAIKIKVSESRKSDVSSRNSPLMYYAIRKVNSKSLFV